MYGHPSAGKRGLISCRTIRRFVSDHMYIPGRGTSALFCCWAIVSWLLFFCFCVPLLSSLVSAWVCSAEFREDLGGQTLFLQIRNGHTVGGGCCCCCFNPGGPYWVLFGFNSPFLWFSSYIMLNAWLDDSQAGIKIVGRNINNHRYATLCHRVPQIIPP